MWERQNRVEMLIIAKRNQLIERRYQDIFGWNQNGLNTFWFLNKDESTYQCSGVNLDRCRKLKSIYENFNFYWRTLTLHGKFIVLHHHDMDFCITMTSQFLVFLFQTKWFIQTLSRRLLLYKLNGNSFRKLI